jgi:hypothetical protein
LGPNSFARSPSFAAQEGNVVATTRCGIGVLAVLSKRKSTAQRKTAHAVTVTVRAISDRFLVSALAAPVRLFLGALVTVSVGPS